MKKELHLKCFSLTREVEDEMGTNLISANICIDDVNELFQKMGVLKHFDKHYRVKTSFELVKKESTTETKVGYMYYLIGGYKSEQASYVDMKTFEERDNQMKENELEKRAYRIMIIQNNENEIELIYETRPHIPPALELAKILNKTCSKKEKYILGLDVFDDFTRELKSAKRVIELVQVYDLVGVGKSPVKENVEQAEKVEISYRAGTKKSLSVKSVIDMCTNRGTNIKKTRIKLTDKNDYTYYTDLEKFQKREHKVLEYEDGEFSEDTYFQFVKSAFEIDEIIVIEETNND